MVEYNDVTLMYNDVTVTHCVIITDTDHHASGGVL